jgi:hypothetical protein
MIAAAVQWAERIMQRVDVTVGSWVRSDDYENWNKNVKTQTEQPFHN